MEGGGGRDASEVKDKKRKEKKRKSGVAEKQRGK